MRSCHPVRVVSREKYSLCGLIIHEFQIPEGFAGGNEI
jgi:hypothetical protein